MNPPKIPYFFRKLLLNTTIDQYIVTSQQVIKMIVIPDQLKLSVFNLYLIQEASCRLFPNSG